MNRFGEEEKKLVLDVLESEDLSPYFRNPDGGKYVQELEKEFADYVGVDYAVAVSNGTSALHTAYLACGLGPGDRILVPAHSFIATVTMVLAVGATPVFGDVSLENYCLDMDAPWPVANAVAPVDLLGYPLDMKRIYETVKPEWPVIEDAAQAFGTHKPNGKHAGSEFNDCATWSFQQTKNFGIGEGGMVTTNDREIARKCKSIRSHGSGYLDDPKLTFNFRMTELAAAVGVAQLRKYSKTLWSIRENGMYVVNHLPAGLRPPPYWPADGKAAFDWNMYIIGCLAEPGFNRAGFVRQLQGVGISKGVPGSVVSLGYSQPLWTKPVFGEGRAIVPPTPNAQELSNRWVWLDIHRFKTLEETKEAVGTIHSVLNDG